MKSAPSPALEAAYRNTRYEVADFQLQVGRHSAELDALLAAHGADFSALLTAANPRSRRQPSRWNDARHVVLARLVQRWRLEGIPSRAVDPHGKWPDEFGLLVPGLGSGSALALARHFNQHALLWCARGGRPQLIWT